MPVQTQKKANVYFPDGAKVEVKTGADVEWFDVGAINSAVTATLNWDESTVETANAGKLNTKISNMEISGGFTLINLDPVGVQKMGGGVFTTTEIEGSPVASPSKQEIAGLAEGIVFALELVDPATQVSFRTQDPPVITTVQVKDGTTLEEGTGYVIVKNDEAPSGWGLVVIDEGSDNGKTLEITYGSNTPIVSTSLHCGSSSVVLKPYAMRITHTDDNGKKRSLELPCVYSNSGGFQFNFKGANEDGIEEMPLTYTARIDTSRLNGQQLMSWTIENGAA